MKRHLKSTSFILVCLNSGLFSGYWHNWKLLALLEVTGSYANFYSPERFKSSWFRWWLQQETSAAYWWLDSSGLHLNNLIVSLFTKRYDIISFSHSRQQTWQYVVLSAGKKTNPNREYKDTDWVSSPPHGCSCAAIYLCHLCPSVIWCLQKAAQREVFPLHWDSPAPAKFRSFFVACSSKWVHAVGVNGTSSHCLTVGWS